MCLEQSVTVDDMKSRGHTENVPVIHGMSTQVSKQYRNERHDITVN